MASIHSIIQQMILSSMRGAKITSANPSHTNTVKEIDVGGIEIGSDEEFKEAIIELIGDVITESESAQDLAQDLLYSEEKDSKKKGTKEATASAVTKKVIGKAKNPASMIGDLLTMLPHAKLVLLAVALAPIIFTIMTQPGGPLDLRFKRIIEDEFNAFLSRQTQKDTEFGIRQVIIQSKIGFTATNGKNNYNTVRGIREGGIDKERLDKVGMVDHTRGVFETG